MAYFGATTIRSRIIVVVSAIAALLTGFAVSLWWATQVSQPPALTQATLYPEPRSLPEFQLVDGNGQVFTRNNLMKRWSFLFFGYTHCPDVCPMTMSIFQQTAQQLSTTPLSTDVTQFVLVSVDPRRDTPEHLGQFVAYFNKDFIGVTGTQQAISELTRDLGIMYSIPDPILTDKYTIDHSASILLVDPEARLHAVFSPPHRADYLVSDLEKLVRHYE